MRKRERGKGTAPVQRIITEKDFRCARQTLPHSDTYAVWVMVNHFDELFTQSLFLLQHAFFVMDCSYYSIYVPFFVELAQKLI